MSFDNVPVPVENVIGEVGSGFKVSFILLCKNISVRLCETVNQTFALRWIGCHEHPQLGEVQYGQFLGWND